MSAQLSLHEFVATQRQALETMGRSAVDWFRALPLLKKAAFIAAALSAAVLGVLALVFHQHIIQLLVTVSDHLEAAPWGGVLLFTLVFFVGFPPLLGFSALSTLCGMVYGFPGGWPLLALALVSGSLVSFLVFRHFLRHRAEQLVAHNEKFRAFAEVLKEDASLFILILIRLCPLPYSLSNGALAAIPNLSAFTYLAASVITSPKMLMHIFIGHTIKNLGDAQRLALAKVLDVVSILVTACAVSLATLLIYRRMQAKLQSYHDPIDASYDDLVFGNFDDESHNFELNVGEFDDDNRIISEPPLWDSDPAPKQQTPPSPPLASGERTPYRDY